MEAAEFERDARNVRVFLFFYAWIALILLIYVAAGPIVDFIHVYPMATGQSANFVGGWAWWPIVIFFAFNFLSIIILQTVIADPDNPARVDLHQIASILAMVANGALLLLFVGYYYFFINTSFGGGVNAFNDARWCCVYHLDHPEQCPNTLDCPGPINSSDLRVDPNFSILWIWVLVFFIIAILQYVFNLVLRRTGAVVPATRSNAKEGEVLGYLMNALQLGLVVYWAAWPLLNTLHLHGYPTLGIPPSPGAFASTRYNHLWVMLALMALNMLPPIVFLCALAIRNTQAFHLLHFWLSIVVSVTTAVVLVVFLWTLIPWAGFCNFYNSPGSICNAYDWCCRFYADAPAYCNNVTPCPNPASLVPNAEFMEHILYAGVFLIMGGVAIWLNYRMKRYGLFVDAARDY